MVAAYYQIMFALSFLLLLCYIFIWHKHFDTHFTLIFCFIPIVNLGYVLMNQSNDLAAALVALKFVYIGGCYMILFLMLSVFSLCEIWLPRWFWFGCFLVTSAVYAAALTIGDSPIFYRSVTRFVNENGVPLFIKEYGPMHTVCYVTVFFYFLLSMGAIIYSFFKKKSVSNRILILLTLPMVICIIYFFGGRSLFPQVELLPLCYVAAQIDYLLIIRRVNLYDITDSGIDSIVQKGDTGFVSFDFKQRYLGSNETARNILPVLSELAVDQPVKQIPSLSDTVLRWLTDFQQDESQNKVYYHTDDSVYVVSINYLYDGHKRRGYQFFLTDDTKNQQYLSLLEHYNTDLRCEVEKKTAHIVEMHNKLLVSMAMMVESRDNSTGGHIRRTSDVVCMLTEEMQKDPAYAGREEFFRNLVKAAPMHDLGKIAVDDAILRKPGRFTPEEFEKMKHHAAEGARIVHEILSGIEDPEFQQIAENVAHYHHERWDGSGYPEGLKNEAIPLEARIMAIADVYDALVSKRVYKESMSFEQADAIITEGMGKHFDKSLEQYYISARPKIEAYYSSTR